MKIGEALREVRLNLGLSQAKMCEGIVQRPFYALVESGKSGIRAESLIMLLIKHEVDINYFYNLVMDSYVTSETQIDRMLQNKMEYAVNSKNIKSINYYKNKIIRSSSDEILKLRAQVTAAYFNNQLDDINDEIYQKIYKEFDKENWIKSPALLRLLANTMPLWKHEILSSRIKHLLHTVQRKKVESELMLERYVRIFENYLVTCYDQKKYKSAEDACFIKEIIDYILNNVTSFHFMIYRFHAYYMLALFENDQQELANIQKILREYGYEDIIGSWPT